jgi:two-component system sensor histidine kinase UhpB
LKDGRSLETAWVSLRLSDNSTLCIGIDITDRKRYEETLNRSKNQLREMAARLAEVEESERKRLAQELHDRVGQLLTAISINLNVALGGLTPDSQERIAPRIADTQKLVEEAAVQIRNTMAELRPPVLDDYGLVVTLQWVCDLFTRRTGIPASVQGEAFEPRLPGARETAVFRIVQEALNNISKHAQAARVLVRVETYPEEILIQVEDDGIGFDLSQIPRGWGLNIMRERAVAVGGELEISSAPGKGTTVTVRVSRADPPASG